MSNPPSKYSFPADQKASKPQEVLIQELYMCCGKLYREYTQGLAIFQDYDAALEDDEAEFEDGLHCDPFIFDYVEVEDPNIGFDLTDFNQADLTKNNEYSVVLENVESDAKVREAQVKEVLRDIYYNDCAAKAAAKLEAEGSAKKKTVFPILRKRKNTRDKVSPGCIDLSSEKASRE